MVAVQTWMVCFTLALSLVYYCNANCSASDKTVKQNLLNVSRCTSEIEMRRNGELYGLESDKDIKLNLVDPKSGILEVVFPLAPDVNITSYTLYLLVALHSDNALTDEKCQRINFNDYPSPSGLILLHTYQIFDRNVCKNVDIPEKNCTSTCMETGFIQFRYIFTGCYSVMFIPRKKDKEKRPYFASNTILHTKYVLERPANINHIFQPIQKKDRFVVHFPNLTALFMDGLRLRFRLSNTTCTYEDMGSFISWVMFFNSSNVLQYDVTNTSTNIPYCEQEFECSSICTFYNVSAGNYCLTMVVDDPVRCPDIENVRLWKAHDRKTSGCKVYTRFTLTDIEELTDTDESSPESSAAEDSYIIAICAMITIIVFMGVIFVGIRVFRTKEEKMLTSYPALDHQPPDMQPQVLLLYAQDCESFMKLMATFRTLLANVGNCEVFDCFDPARAEEVALSPIEWMCYRMNNPTVKVVVVASDCAVAHQRALEAGIRLHYCQPLPYNMLFQHGLKTLIYDSDHKEYLKTFVVSFGNQDLTYLTPYTRFSLPLHILELLKNFNRKIHDLSLEEFKEVQRLMDDHANFLSYKQQNTNYLGDLMSKYAEVV